MPRRRQPDRHPHMAWWCLPSFQRISDGIEPTKVFFIGHHITSRSKTRTFKNPPAPDFALITETEQECIPFFSDDIPAILAGIQLCSVKKNFQKLADLNLRLYEMRGVKKIYREFNIHDLKIADAIQLSNKYGENWTVTVDLSKGDVLWLKGCFAYKQRIGVEHSLSVDQIVLVGKDVRYNVPVIALCKDWMDYRGCMHFWDGGIRTFSSIKFIIYHRPEEQYALLSPTELEDRTSEELERLKKSEFVTIDFTQPVKGIKEQIE